MIRFNRVDDRNGFLNMKAKPNQFVLSHLQVLMPFVLQITVLLESEFVDIVGDGEKVVHDVLLSGQNVLQRQLREGQCVAEHRHEEVIDLESPAQDGSHSLHRVNILRLLGTIKLKIMLKYQIISYIMWCWGAPEGVSMLRIS